MAEPKPAAEDEWSVPLVQPAGASPRTVPGEWDAPLVAPPILAVAPATPRAEGAARLKMIPQAVATGVKNVLALPGAMEDAGNQFLPSFMTRPIGDLISGNKTPDLLRERKFPTAATIDNALAVDPFLTNHGIKLGLEHHPELKPETPVERYGMAVAEALPSLVLTRGMTLPTAVSATVGGAVAAQGAKDLMPESKWAPIVAGVVGAIGSGWASSATETWLAGKDTIKNWTKAEAALEAAKDAKRLGSQDAQKAFDELKVTSNERLTAVKAAAKTVEESAAEQSTRDFKTVADAIGPSRTTQQTGESLQTQVRKWITETMPAKMKAVVEPLDKAVPAETELLPGTFNGAYAAIDKENLINRLDLPDKLKTSVVASLKAGEPMNWGEVRKLRTAIGDAMGRPKIISDIGEQNIKQLYAAVTADLAKTAEAVGAGDLFKVFNQESTRLHELASGVMSKVVSSKNAAKDQLTPGDSVKNLFSGTAADGTVLAQLRSELPGAVDELASLQLRDPKAWQRLSPEARAALVPDPGHHQVLTVAEAAEQLAKGHSEKMITDAALDHAKTIELARTGKALAEHQRANAVEAAKKIVKAAKAAVPPRKNPMTEIASMVQKAAAVAAGYQGGPWVLNQLGIHVAPETGAIFGAAALGAPLVAKGARAVAGNPALAAIPVTGVLAGQNANALDLPAKGK